MFSLRATLSDGFTFDLAEVYPTQWQADRAACNYIRDYSDPCGRGVRCSEVAVIDQTLRSVCDITAINQ